MFAGVRCCWLVDPSAVCCCDSAAPNSEHFIQISPETAIEQRALFVAPLTPSSKVRLLHSSSTLSSLSSSSSSPVVARTNMILLLVSVRFKYVQLCTITKRHCGGADANLRCEDQRAPAHSPFIVFAKQTRAPRTFPTSNYASAISAGGQQLNFSVCLFAEGRRRHSCVPNRLLHATSLLHYSYEASLQLANAYAHARNSAHICALACAQYIKYEFAKQTTAASASS